MRGWVVVAVAALVSGWGISLVFAQEPSLSDQRMELERRLWTFEKQDPAQLARVLRKLGYGPEHQGTPTVSGPIEFPYTTKQHTPTVSGAGTLGDVCPSVEGAATSLGQALKLLQSDVDHALHVQQELAYEVDTPRAQVLVRSAAVLKAAQLCAKERDQLLEKVKTCSP